MTRPSMFTLSPNHSYSGLSLSQLSLLAHSRPLVALYSSIKGRRSCGASAGMGVGVGVIVGVGDGVAVGVTVGVGV